MNTTAQAYFAAHAAEAQTAYADPLYEARKIKKGDKMVVGSGLKFATRAKEDGWLLKSGAAGRCDRPVRRGAAPEAGFRRGAHQSGQHPGEVSRAPERGDQIGRASCRER